MRYACTNHTAEQQCSGDQANWCVWQLDPEGTGHCLLHFGAADFVHFLMWSGTRLPCAGSKVSQIVQCSFSVASGDCSAAGCQWTEGACYPKFYASIITKPKPLAAFKRQVCRQLGMLWPWHNTTDQPLLASVCARPCLKTPTSRPVKRSTKQTSNPCHAGML